MPKLSDEELVAACLAGRESAYAVLVERFTPRLYRVAARLCRDPRDAEEAVQEALIQATRDLAKWRPVAPLEAWLVTITVRTAQKVDERAARTAKRGESLDRPMPDGGTRELRDAAPGADPVVAAAQGDLSNRLAAAVASLPPKYRAAVTLRFQEGLSTKEIASTLGIPEATVRTHLARGLKELRTTLGDLGGERRPS
ncbi:MAG: RNA polymerase sigma factor [Candidatus Limnocylindrus sp.]|jgi:RNA polymerase sigma-70 factor (ECF subfamily)